MKRILCVCKGNSERSPQMNAYLEMFLKQAGFNDFVIHSAGIIESIKTEGGGASSFAQKAAGRIGIDLSTHRRTHIDDLDLQFYDLVVCAENEVASVVYGHGVDIKKICNINVVDPWPSQFQEDHDQTTELLLGAMYRVIKRYFYYGKTE